MAMATFLVTYDLMGAGKNYIELYVRLSHWRAYRALESVWLVTADTSAASLRDDLRRYIHPDDRLLVARLSAETAWPR